VPLLLPCSSFVVPSEVKEPASAFAFLAVIPAGNLLLPLLFWLSFPQGICFYPRLNSNLATRNSKLNRAILLLLLPLPLLSPFFLFLNFHSEL
jgi:hypothetical protein